jgi:ABC-type cobalt transport system substrate-binding protein
MKTRRNDPCPCGSGKKYKRCCLGRETSAAEALLGVGLASTGSSANGAVYSFDQIKERLSEFTVTETLAAIAERIWQQFEKGEDAFKELERDLPWAFLFLAQTSIRFGSELSIKRIDDAALEELVAMYRSFDDPLFADEGGDVPSLLLRMSYEQFTYQESLRTLIPRTIALYERLPREASPAPPFDIDGALRNAYGMPLDDFMRTGLVVGAAARQHQGRLLLRELENSIVPGLSSSLEAGQLRRVLQVIGASYRDFKRLFEERESKYPVPAGYEKYGHNVLLEKPVVWADGDSGRVLVPSPVLIFWRVTRSIYYDLIGVAGNAFATWFGWMVQAYVDRLIGHFEGLLREADFGVDGAPDFALVDGERGALIEVKSGRLGHFSRAIGDREHLKEDLKKSFFPACEQLYKKREKIRSGARGYERFRDVKDPHLVVITLEPVYLANAPPIRDVVDELAREREWEPIPYQAISLQELELIAPHLTALQFLDALDRKRNGRWWSWPFEALFEDQISEYRGKMQPWFQQLWEEFARKHPHLTG